MTIETAKIWWIILISKKINPFEIFLYNHSKHLKADVFSVFIKQNYRLLTLI